MNILIKDTYAVLPDDPGFKVQQVSIGIKDDRIEFTGEVPKNFLVDKVIDGRGKLAIPGLVNSHTHAYMTVFRNCADDLLFGDWLFGRIMPLEDKLTAEDCYWGTLLAFMEMLRSGTTCFNDMYIFCESAARAASECGMRAVLSRGLTGGTEDTAGGERRLREAADEFAKWKNCENLKFMLAPHAPYTCDDGYMREVAQTAASMGVGIHTHISESRNEIAVIKEKYGATPVELMDKCGLLSENTVAAHCVYLTENDISVLAERRVSVATNPISNLKLANGAAPVPKLIKAGVNVCLGTDGAASNNSLNMFKDLSFLTLLHKGINEDPVAVTASEGFAAATINGAKALKIDSGLIKSGLKADIAVLNLDVPNMQPVNNALSSLCYSANGSEVETVIVNGQILMENREFKTIDKDRVLFEVNNICKRIGTKCV